MSHVDPTLERNVHGVVQGFPGAAQVLYGLHETFEFEEYELMVSYLYKCGPRGPRLWERFRDRCDCDFLTLGRDLLAQATELRGWPDGD